MPVELLAEPMELLEIGAMLFSEDRSINQVLNLRTVMGDARAVDSGFSDKTTVVMLDVGCFLETCDSRWVITCTGPRDAEIVERLHIPWRDAKGLFEQRNGLA